MRKKGALRRGTRRAASVFVALACVFLGSVQAQTSENKAVKDFVVEPGGVVRIKGKADLADIAAANDAAKAKRAEAKAKTGETRPLAPKERVLETRAVFYPTELAWGDAAYFATVERNIADETRNIYAPFDYERGKFWDLGEIKITADGISGEYVYANELAFGKENRGIRGGFAAHMDAVLVRKSAEIAPGEERFRARTALEFPPLEDSNKPFWTAVRERLKTEGRVVLHVSVEFDRCESVTTYRSDVFKTDVVLNKRIISEMETLDAWREKTSQNLTPKLEDGERYKRPRPEKNGAAGTLRGNEKSFISLNGETYDPWAFVRVGNRKPCDPNNPTTLEGWRKLEKVFETGTLRDEITFVRLQLEYYAAPRGKETVATLEKLLAWLAERPEAQRAVLAASVASKSSFFKGKELEDRRGLLVASLEKNADRWGPSYERFRKEEAPFGEATSQIFEPFPEPFAIETRNVVWPQEAFFGDAVYFAAIDRNVSSTLGGAGNALDMEYLKRHFASAVVVEAEGIDAKHQFFHEFNSFDMITPRPEDPKTPLPPDAERVYAQFAVEFPPLEDWNDVFWTAVREKLATEKRVVLHIKLSYGRGYAQWDTVETELVLKPRPEKEMELISSWRDATPYDLLPERVGQHKLKETPRSDDYSQIARSGFEAIALDGSDETFSPWLFARVGNRKPSDPNNPTTLDGWRELENEFAPSTLRDEITFVRLQLEYYAASRGKETEAASKALVAWLAARPEAQRLVLAASVFSKAPQFEKTRLNEKYVALVEAIRAEPEMARLLEKRELVWKAEENENAK